MVLNHSLKWGVLLGISISFATQVLTWLGLGLTNWFMTVTLVLVLITFIFSTRELIVKSSSQHWWKGITAALITVIIGRIIFQSYMYVYTRYINSGWVEEVSVTWKEMLMNKGTDQITIDQQIASFQNSYETIPMFTSALIVYAIPQLILGIIVTSIILFKYRNKTHRLD